MPIYLSDLLAAPGLDLRRHGTAPVAPAPLQWVAVTELEDPFPFLGGGEVVLTTGLRQRTGAVQRSFVESVHRAGALAIGFGTGLSHAKVPAALIEAADARGLPVFEVPYDTPFVALGKMVADALSADHVTQLRDLLAAHQSLAGALLGGNGLPGLLQELAGLLGNHVALHQYGARIFDTGSEAGEDSGAASRHRVPIATGLRDRCTLAITEPYRRPDIVAYAQSLISVELSNQARRRARDRAVTGQLLTDVVAGRLTGGDASLRLLGAGISTARRQLTFLVEVASGQVRALPTLPLPAEFDGAGTAVVDGRLVIVVAEGNGPVLARILGAYLYGSGLTARIGFGGSYAEPAGLRWSYFEAKESLQRGQHINEPERLSLTSLLMSGADVPLADLAAEALDPLTDFDAAHDASLLDTLEQYLGLNGSVAAVADALGLHRNTVRYRLGQITELTGYDPAITADRVHLFLALNVRRLGVGRG
ncbi:PucR family transcriptional regulator ligand-binding domain-containing protein [Arthrobacter sp. zg-Y820]|uniref:PucR family transcriptional regulator n=1 Tax=unclassified Arthrobacter TaxID=235627 RepID=UPI001E3DE856|nr:MULTISPECIES: PucR family transcriptional regulator ligand-binding domain-containing protein [unclassified Arthrobacter]MCC9195693.1 PucR family transcriptional regulator ligand-binding domain-containing protein [Arthrobacter sp. zg-Y820]MDK1278552.1 PucR family transcriptional regulator ligand-binding domain-containing protein [Arthrobacter sp. zg.Y820]WIB09013.1 PucR family transcriptional regulator ligand-binding domain-containing protein [Arthrobacter sp. zg-Y820]